MDRVELGLLGAPSFPELSVLLWVSGEVSSLRAVDRMALVLVIEASGLTVPGWVVWSGGLGSQLLVPEERVPEPEVVVVVVAEPELEPLPGLAELVLLGVGLAWRRDVSSILGSRWDFRSVACSFPIVKRNSRIFFLPM